MMMATTHVLVGMLAAVLLTAVLPGAAPLDPLVVLVGGLGGLVPDLDLYAGHRRLLHYPVLGLSAAAAVGTLGLWGAPQLALAVVFLTGFGLHAAMDVLGGGLELEPWRRGSARAVYSHVHGRWLTPRYVIPFDGSPQDLLLVVAAAGTLLWVGPPSLRSVVLAIAVVSVLYTLVRRRVPTLTRAMAARVPLRYRGLVPARFVE